MLRIVVFVFLLMLASPCLAAPSYEEVKTSFQSSDAVLLDRHGEVIHELRVDAKFRKLEWVALAAMSPALVKAVVRSEDKRFYEHNGVDWLAVFSATFSNLFSNHKRGASTITMQLASLLGKTEQPRKSRRPIAQKWAQMQAARELEKSWTKEQILESYLNFVSFRGELQGIAAAARGLFDKEPSGLDEAEAAVLAALIRSPNSAPDKVGDRAVLLAASLGNTVSAELIRQLVHEKLARPYSVRKRVDLAPHVAQRLLRRGMTSAASTLDAGIQRFASDAIRESISRLASQNVGDGAALVVENETGDVLAYVGNAGNISSAFYVDGIQARRQAGSTLKPFLYGLAIEKKIITAASLIDDAPLDMPTERGVYRPENYDLDFRGMVTARTALASSLNIPAVKTFNLVGPEAFVQKLQAFGFSGLLEAEHYGPSLALGSADITLWDLVNGYRAIANSGVWSRLRLSPVEESGPPSRALSAEAAFIISNILSDREARSATFSLESPLATRFWTAVKTGTSKDMRDNWCVGYSSLYTVGVWVGNFSGAPMWNVSGVSGAAPVWLEMMNFLHRDTPSRSPLKPAGVSAGPVLADKKGLAVGKQEWFIAGTEQSAPRLVTRKALPKIIYPAPDTVIAVDPDIPAELQKVMFESSSDDPSFRLAVDNAVIGSAPLAAWQPSRGAHHLALIGRDGTIEDQLTFEVR
ncbi:MAG: penicillin-binding protein 1C [Deltaproteobacteria bacterium RIFOXYD12_FULL_57_12]|nr:MAG: penicillin-binding protein 1C [Deltaproteobacteria bacterium RIFOXYD12_FULL_57_12]